MHVLTATSNTQPDYVALAMVLVLAVFVAFLAIRKKLSANKPAQQPEEAPAPAEAPKAAVAPGSAGQIKLNNVEPKTAAMIMAIVADKMGKPLNELRFISIQEVEEV